MEYKMDNFELVRVDVKGLGFMIRKGTSDFKTIEEVVIGNIYEKKGMKIEAGEQWLDFGANIGAFTALALSKGASVHAFEPDPLSFDLLESNAHHNAKGTAKGISLEFTRAGVHAGPERVAGLMINKRGNFWRNSVIHKQTGGTIPVALKDYRDYVKDGICVKMDIEGSEFGILRDLDPALKLKKLVFEYSFDVDGEMAHFWAIIEKLRGMFEHVEFDKIDPAAKYWLKSWYPAAKIIYCY